ncbi:MAG TPA: subtype I-C CRISPR-associated endonuclease Cas1 [Spirochaeta sp.]|nr:subtype I-C CRISPR-associated endonuclease Cas1 [Spirochaeta sp.]
MRKLLNTIYVTTQGSYLHKERETLVVNQNHKEVLQLPLHNIGGIVCFGNVSCSPFLMGACAENDISISFLTEYGKYLARVTGPVRGNVLLRREQYRKADDLEVVKSVASNIISAKMVNSRIVINRSLRDHPETVDKELLKQASKRIITYQQDLKRASDTDKIRGLEGAAAAQYFSVFNEHIIDNENGFLFSGRNRRPPLDEVNALLSFTYTLLLHDVRSALETVGLDPSVGFLHKDRPGRPGLALDLMEEFRSVIADRLVLSLINRRQISISGFEKAENSAVTMRDDTRKTILTEYQKRKQTKIFHPFIEEDVPIGLLFFIQATLMARYLRGELNGYPPFFWR